MTMLREWIASVNQTCVYVPDGRGGHDSFPVDEYFDGCLDCEIAIERQTDDETIVHVPEMDTCDYSRLRLDDHDTGADLYMTTEYAVRHTTSGYAVSRPDGRYAEFLDHDEASDVAWRLESGEADEDDYEWIQAH